MLARLPLFTPLAVVVLLLSATPGAGRAASTINMENRALACTGCHGESGVATPDGYFPRIAGKPAGYLFNQLINFKSGARRFDGMNRLVKSLPNEYLLRFAQYFAELDLPYPPPEQQRLSALERVRASELVNKGDRTLGVPACKSCHGDKLTGVLPSVPGLLGLPRDYLTAQLGAWKNDIRSAHDPDCMATIVKRLSLADITAVSGWLAAQPVVAGGKPVPADKHRKTVGEPALQCGSDNAPARVRLAANRKAPLTLQKGRYLARLGNCAGCHQLPAPVHDALRSATRPAYGGGVPIQTPFGRVYGSNISSSRTAGIGAWQPEVFYRAMTQGIDAGGAALNPVFPYQFFSGLLREDSDALLQWLKAGEPVDQVSPPHDLRFPYGTGLALTIWRWLYVDKPDSGAVPATTDDPVSLARGRYLVETLMHCNACHGERDFLGGFTRDDRLGGQKLPGDAGYAPSLGAAHEAGMSHWSISEIQAFLLTGHNRHADANGLMAQVVQNSTQHLNAEDVASVALYLKSGITQASPDPDRANGIGADATAMTLPLWRDNCAACHADNGQGKDDLGPPLAGRRSVQLADPSNLLISILHGGFGPATKSRPFPPGMPGFAHRLTDQQIALLATTIRQSWGNQGPPVRAVDVQRLR